MIASFRDNKMNRIKFIVFLFFVSKIAIALLCGGDNKQKIVQSVIQNLRIFVSQKHQRGPS